MFKALEETNEEEGPAVEIPVQQADGDGWTEVETTKMVRRKKQDEKEAPMLSSTIRICKVAKEKTALPPKTPSPTMSATQRHLMKDAMKSARGKACCAPMPRRRTTRRWPRTDAVDCSPGTGTAIHESDSRFGG